MIRIEFTYSTSKQFPVALKMARRFSEFSEINGMYSITFNQADIFNDWELFSMFHNIVAPWTGTNLYFNGNLIKPHKYRLYYAFQEVANCIKQEKRHHCEYGLNQPGWGCIKLNRIKRHIDYYASQYWYNYGKFSPDMLTWSIDKTTLFDELINDAREMYLIACPFFEVNKIKEQISTLPDHINIDKKQWEIVYKNDFIGDRIGMVPIGIKHIVNDRPEHSQGLFVKFGVENMQDNDKTNELPDKPFDKLTEDEINRLIERKSKKP